MKKKLRSALLLISALTLTACGSGDNVSWKAPQSREIRSSGTAANASADAVSGNSAVEEGTASGAAASDSAAGALTNGEASTSETSAAADDTLVVYFSRVGNTEFPEGIDTNSTVSLLVDGSGALYGNTQVIATWIAEELGTNTFAIKTKEKYPADYDTVLDQADAEQKAGTRPALTSHIENFDSYQTFHIVFPIWWYDFPMAMYSFFDEYDFSGKTIYLTATYYQSEFVDTLETLKKLEPNANVIQGIAVSSEKMPGAEKDVRDFADGLK